MVVYEVPYIAKATAISRIIFIDRRLEKATVVAWSKINLDPQQGSRLQDWGIGTGTRQNILYTKKSSISNTSLACLSKTDPCNTDENEHSLYYWNCSQHRLLYLPLLGTHVLKVSDWYLGFITIKCGSGTTLQRRNIKILCLIQTLPIRIDAAVTLFRACAGVLPWC